MIDRVSLVTLSLIAFAWGGAIRGNILYQGTGIYAVIAIPGGIADTIDFTSMPMDTIIETSPLNTSRAYEIVSDFDDMTPYIVVSMLIPRFPPMPQSGDPCGIYPYDVYTIGGFADNINISLATSGRLGGHINYSGDISVIKINVYDLFQQPPVLERTYSISSHNYLIENVPSGPKSLEAFADLNGNNAWDESEPIVEYQSETGSNVIFIGGGDRFATGVDFNVPSSDVLEHKATSPSIRLETNRICFSTNSTGTIEILDILGRELISKEIRGEGYIDLPAVSSGIYLARIQTSGESKTQIIHILK